MNWPNQSATNGQQAPTPSREQTSPSGPSQTTCRNAQPMGAEMAWSASHRASTVRFPLPHDENRVARSHANGPTFARGGGRYSAAASSAMLPLHQRDAAVEPIHEERGRKAQREEQAHGHQDHLDGLA